MPDYVPFAEQIERALRSATTLDPVTVPIADALGLQLADDLIAVHALPTTDNSAMDGYAVRRASVESATADAPVRLRVIADIPAGSGDEPRIGIGECARIMTGAPVPASADAIVPLEATTLGTDIDVEAPDEIAVTIAPKPAAHIRRRGEDIEAGELVVPAGAVMGARAIAAAIAAGVAEARVVPRARVAIISTGDELVPVGQPLERGRIPDSNGPLLRGLVTEADAVVASVECVSDRPESFLAAVERAAAVADVIVTTGGVSVGAFDVARLSLEERGIVFANVGMQPGKPQGYGRLGGGGRAMSGDEVGEGSGPTGDGGGESGGPLVFCLPGNPVSVCASFESFVRPVLRKLAGYEGAAHHERPGVAAEGWTCPRGRLQLMPVRVLWEGTDGRLTVAPATSGGSGSHLVARLARAEALAIVPADVSEVRAGDPLSIWEILP